MKFFAIFAVLVVAVAADFSSWSLYEISNAIQNPNTDPTLLPALEQALNDKMDAIYAEEPVVPADESAPVDLTGWTLHDLSEALQNPETDPALIPHLEHALDAMMDAIYAGIPVEAVGVAPVTLEVSYWSLLELSEALQDPKTDPALIPYLEHALNQIMDALYSGQQMEGVAIVAPAGLAPVRPEPVVVPTPIIIPTPIEETPVEETPVAPSTKPLVQIIVNIQQ